MSDNQITCVNIFKEIVQSKLYSFVLIITIFFSVGAHFFMTNYVFNSFYEKLIINIIDDANKIAKYISIYHNEKKSNDVLNNKLLKIQTTFNIKKIKLFDNNGLIFYSSHNQEIGQKTKQKEFFTMVAKGQVFYKIINYENNPNSKNAEIYIPVFKNGNFIGASEIYYDITSKLISLNELEYKMKWIHTSILSLTVLTIFVLLFISGRNSLIRKYNHEKNKKNELSLQQHTRLLALKEMLENISHQWRQPLSCITMIISGLKIKQELGILTQKDIEEANDGIISNANFLSNTIEKFKHFVQNNDKKINFNIAQVIKDTLPITTASFHTHNIKVILNLDEKLSYEGIPQELSQVLLNLLINSKEALIANKIIDKLIIIDLFETDENIQIKITDNALGINKKIINKIFDPYFTTKHQYSGTGLGLYISLQIIKNQFNGEVYYKNIQEKTLMGSCFTIKLPRLKEISNPF